MTPQLTSVFRRPFAEQVAAFRLRLGNLVPTAKWDDLRGAEHDRAFMVAGAVKADLLADLGNAIDKAIAAGQTLDWFRKEFRGIVEKHGWHGWTGEGTKGGEAWRTRVIYRTNMATTYAAGRMAQLVEGGFPLWVYRHGASREPREQHLAWDGLILPPDHPFWQTHAPPNGWGCSCYVLGARSEAGARRLGGRPELRLPDDWDRLDPKTGAPRGIDKGWGHSPGASVANEVSILAAKLPKLPAEIGAALFAFAPRSAIDELERQFARFVDDALSSFVRNEHIVVGALKPAWVEAAAKRSIRIASAEIAVTDKQVQHMFRGTAAVTAPSTKGPTRRAPKVSPVDLDWFKKLPTHLLTPRAVLLDRRLREPSFLLIYEVPGSKVRLVVRVNSHVKKATTELNLLVSGRLIDVSDLRADLGDPAGLVEQVDGLPLF